MNLIGGSTLKPWEKTGLILTVANIAVDHQEKREEILIWVHSNLTKALNYFSWNRWTEWGKFSQMSFAGKVDFQQRSSVLKCILSKLHGKNKISQKKIL